MRRNDNLEISPEAHFCDGDSIDIYWGDELAATVHGRDEKAMEKARLFKHAPDLYEALKRMVYTHTRDERGDSRKATLYIHLDDLDAAETAIEKAEGG